MRREARPRTGRRAGMARLYVLLIAMMVALVAAGLVVMSSGDNAPAFKDSQEAAASGDGQATQHPSPAHRQSNPVEEEVIANILAQRVGNRTLADDGLPRDFLRRLAHRVICESFEEQFRMVVDDRGAGVTNEAETRRGGNDVPRTASALAAQLVEREIVTAVQEYRRRLPSGGARPPLRGFRAPILEHAGERWPFELAAQSPRALKRSADLVGSRLARDGLLRTLQLVIDEIGPAAFLDGDAKSIEVLRAIGYPLDWLDHFQLESGARGMAIVRVLAQQLKDSRGEKVDRMLAEARFDFHPSRAGFVVAPESGEHEIATVRAQLTRGDDWLGAGDGGSVDMLREMLAAAPHAECVVSIERKHLEQAKRTVGAWPVEAQRRIVLVPEELPLAQWAQDNGKAGMAVDEAGVKRAVTIVPRFASRGDDGSTFVPGETFCADGWRAAGLEVFQSPLLFQGGNLLAVRHPKTGERILLIGEAEVYRNAALGLSEAQALEAFRVELAVDRVHKLPTVSFHLDYDVTIRACGQELVAFVNDDEAAAKIIISCGVEALHKAKVLSDDDAAKARNVLAQKHAQSILNWVWPVLQRNGFEKGSFPLSFAEVFSVGPTDSGVGNLHRFVLAFDLLASRTVTISQITDANLKTYYEALHFQRGERDRFHRALAELGFHIVHVPSLAHGSRSINAINGIHTSGNYYMPSYGGMYAPLDEAAKETFAQMLGDEVEVVSIRSAESQRRNGAVHCAYSVVPE